MHSSELTALGALNLVGMTPVLLLALESHPATLKQAVRFSGK